MVTDACTKCGKYYYGMAEFTFCPNCGSKEMRTVGKQEREALKKGKKNA